MSIWGTRCRKGMVYVYWDRIEEMGRWVMGTLQWKLHKRILLQHPSNWD